MNDQLFLNLKKIVKEKGWVSFERLFIEKKFEMNDLIELERSGYISTEISDYLFCLKCKLVSEAKKLGDNYICFNCEELYNVNNPEQRLLLSSFYPDMKKFSTLIIDKSGLEFSLIDNNILDTDIWEIGVTINNLDVCIVRGEITTSQVMILYGHLFTRALPLVLIYFEISDKAKEYIESHPLNVLFTFKYTEDTVLDNIRELDYNYSKQSEETEKISTILGTKNLPKIPALKNGRINQEEIIELSKSGGYAFEEPAIAMLWTLGIPYLIKFDKANPEGALLQKDGFYLIDVKSSAGSFDFRISERDKMKRYITKFQNNSSLYPDFKPLGMGIITRDITKNAIRNVRDYFHEFEFDGIFVIFKLNALLFLITLIEEQPEYWYKFDIRKHPEQLFYGKGEINKEWQEMKKRYKISNSNIVVIDNILIQKYAEIVYKDLVKGNPHLLNNISHVLMKYIQ